MDQKTPKEIREFIYEATKTGDEIKKGECTAVYKYKYDSNGRILERDEIKKGECTAAYKYKYDNNGRILERPGHRYKYDDKGRKIEELYVENETPYNKLVFKYDDRGNETEFMQYYLYDNGCEQLIYQSESKYDECGMLVEFWFDSIDGWTEHHFYRYEYDGTGKMMKMYDRERLRVNTERPEETVTVYVYGANSLLAEKMYDTSTGLMLSFTQYDSNDNVTEECTYDLNGNILERNLYVYDRFNNVIKNEAYTGTYLLHRNESEYVYDSENNWIQIVTTTEEAGNVVHSVIERKIEYY